MNIQEISRIVFILAPFFFSAGCSDNDDATRPGDEVTQAHSSNAGPAQGDTLDSPLDRRPLFGDLHIHSSWSLDSYVNFNKVEPAMAYRFARGEEVKIAGGRRVKLEIPLDFAAVTDHAEYFGELSLCLDSETRQYSLPICQDIRNDEQKRELITRVYKNMIIR